ncbi:unnamed protein product [Symbiodinium necroappetens]|uniref:Uncharacterized protein n=1 Tax=Symbiodinium necroappetens TaxID=1628268 RepID=A0A812TP78_9DINO|nr:unnamed protein product [Symbiodinium necroappetens]
MLSRCLYRVWSCRALGRWWNGCWACLVAPYFGLSISAYVRRVAIFARSGKLARAVLEGSLGFLMLTGLLLSFRGSCKLFVLERSDAYADKLRQNQRERGTAVQNGVHLCFFLVWTCCTIVHLLQEASILMAVLFVLGETQVILPENLGSSGSAQAVLVLAIVAVGLPFAWFYMWFRLQLGMAPWPLVGLLELAAAEVRQLEAQIEDLLKMPISARRVRELSVNYLQLHGRLRALSALAGTAPALILAGAVMQSLGLLMFEVLEDDDRFAQANIMVTGLFLSLISPTLVAFVRMAWVAHRCDGLGAVGLRLLSQTTVEGRSDLHDDADCTDLLLRFMYTVQAVPTGWFIGPTRAGPSFVLRAFLSVLVSALKQSWAFFFPDDWAEGDPRLGTILFAIGMVLLSASCSAITCLKAEVQLQGSPTLDDVELPISQIQLESSLHPAGSSQREAL